MKYEEIKELEKLLKINEVYITASIEGKGCHIGRFKGLALDADDGLIIDVDIDKESCTR